MGMGLGLGLGLGLGMGLGMGLERKKDMMDRQDERIFECMLVCLAVWFFLLTIN